MDSVRGLNPDKTITRGLRGYRERGIRHVVEHELIGSEQDIDGSDVGVQYLYG